MAAGGVAAAALTIPNAGAQAAAATYDAAYLAVNPRRAYDSRSGPKLYPLEERTLQTTFEPEVLAITVNLTATATEAPGWLALFPGDISWPGTSSVNWTFPNMDIANNAFVSLPENKLLTVRCGGQGAAHFVIDVIGISVLVDTSELTSAEDVRTAARQRADALGEWKTV